jgi:predicted permease
LSIKNKKRMLVNNLKLALRTLSKQKGFALLNILGLSVGVASMLLIFRMVQYELSFNKNFQHYDRIVRVCTQEKGLEGQEGFTRGVPVPAMLVMKNTIPQFAANSRIKEYWPTVLVPNPTGGAPLKKFNTEEGEIAFFAENSFLEIFDFKWLAGEKNKVLQEPNTVVLSKKNAIKCFGTWQNAVGQTVLLDNEPMMIQGVIEDAPTHCDFPVSMLVSYQTLISNAGKYEYSEDWGSTSSNDQIFALLHDPSQFREANIAIEKVGRKEYDRDGAGQNAYKGHLLQPLSDMHFDDRFGTFATHVISKSRLWILTSIGLLILLMACFNFINLSTATALSRSKEVGVRKTLGGSQSALFSQFMTETALVVCFSVGLGTVLAWAGLPLLERISEVPTEHPFLEQPTLWVFVAGLSILVTFLSGFYPALVLAGFNPIKALKNDLFTQASSGNGLRKGLVILQFLIAQALIVGTIITLGQLDYIRNMDMGFRKELVYTFNLAGDSLSQTRLGGFKQRLLQIPGVEAVTFSSDQPSSGSTWMTNFAIGRGTRDQRFSTSMKFCDADFQKAYGMKLLAGRWLEPGDTVKEYLVNETLLKKAGVTNPEAALNMELRLGSGKWRQIVGVVKDFHSHSAHQELEPMVLTSNLERFYTAGAKISPQNIKPATEAIQRTFDETFQEQVFDASFFDEQIADFYIDENRFADTCKGFGAIAIFISCLGLLGLATHAARRRTKEIGIRKVLGAGVSNITLLLAKDFLKLVLIAVVLASPIAYYLMDKWLADFSYRIDIQWWMFALAGIAAMIIAFTTVSFQSIKAALANPVKSLKSE